MNLPLCPSEAELIAAKEVGAFALSSLWKICHDYGVAGPRNRQRLIERGSVIRRYAPITRLELPTELARLKNGDEEAVVRFAQRYGLLGRASMIDGRRSQGESLKGCGPTRAT
jgi:hypothetical protein